jgi:hypothetical protein
MRQAGRILHDTFLNVRGMVLGILVLGMAGTAAELVLLQHYEDWWQIVPLALFALAICALLWHGVTRGPASVRGIQAVMTLFVFSGAIGVGLHYSANAEFEREMDPSLAGARLFRESLSGATPALAPGTMVQLGLLGLVFTYRHPRLTAADEDHSRRQKWDAQES